MNINNAINIYCVYQLDPIASSRDTSFTIQNVLFGAMQITKNATDSDKSNYKGYGICFDERSKKHYKVKKIIFVCAYYKDEFKKMKFGDKEVDKKEFYLSKQAISLDSVDLDKIVVSNKWKINETTYKYLYGYLNNDVIQPLCVILPQMHGYIKYFDDGGKNMTFVTDNEKVYDKYIEIWEVIRKLLKVKFAVNPVRDDKYLIAKLKIFNKINRTTFNDDNNKNNIPKERSHYICIPAIDIDSVLKIDNKKAYPQAYLEQCKYKLKKRKIVNYIDDEIIDEDSDSNYNDTVDSHLSFLVPDSYVEI